MLQTVRIHILAAKYWLQGDDWDEAMSFATRIVKGFR